jgi:predicted enzyme involved in methoxymalonyl-ACP biosynthesis
MSCRVLKRQVEEEVLNEIVRLAVARGCASIKGVYKPTAKNGMVREHYASLGFTPIPAAGESLEFALDALQYTVKQTKIRIDERAYDAR